jgi:hypothetical protein
MRASSAVAMLMGLMLLGGCGLFAAPGQACRKHEECAGLKEGYCSRAEICTKECSDTVTCPENSACSTQGARRVCLPTCEKNEDCLKGFACTDAVCQLASPFTPPPP